MPDGPHLWTENDMYLAGIQTSWSKKGQYLKGTVISHALTMISGWFSDHTRYYPNARARIVLILRNATYYAKTISLSLR